MFPIASSIVLYSSVGTALLSEPKDAGLVYLNDGPSANRVLEKWILVWIRDFILQNAGLGRESINRGIGGRRGI